MKKSALQPLNLIDSATVPERVECHSERTAIFRRSLRISPTYALFATPAAATCYTPVLFAQSNDQQASTTPQVVLLYAEQKFRGNFGTTFQDSDPAQFPSPINAPDGAPNVLLILLDDVGFGQFSASDGGVPSPAMDKLAQRGLLYTRFHTTALCSPTRAALLTERNHNVFGTGVITELARRGDGRGGEQRANCPRFGAVIVGNSTVC